MQDTIFTINVRTSGNLLSSFVFENSKSKDDWMTTKLPLLEQKYGKLQLKETELPGLKVGDRCFVVGEGLEVFTITGIKKYSEDRYGFCLNSGWCEEVGKCYRGGL